MYLRKQVKYICIYTEQLTRLKKAGRHAAYLGKHMGVFLICCNIFSSSEQGQTGRGHWNMCKIMSTDLFQTFYCFKMCTSDICICRKRVHTHTLVYKFTHIHTLVHTPSHKHIHTQGHSKITIQLHMSRFHRSGAFKITSFAEHFSSSFQIFAKMEMNFKGSNILGTEIICILF